MPVAAECMLVGESTEEGVGVSFAGPFPLTAGGFGRLVQMHVRSFVFLEGVCEFCVSSMGWCLGIGLEGLGALLRERSRVSW